MSCKKYQKMLFLNRSGELSQSEILQLQHHLSTCTACAALQNKINHDAEMIKNIRQTKISVPNAPQMTDDILSLTNIQQFAGKAKNNSRTDHLSSQFALPRLRIVLAVFVFLITVGFLAQEMVILGRISKLEKQLADKTATPSRVVRESMDMNSFIKRLDHIATIKDDKMLIDKQALETLLQSYRELKINNKILLQYLQDHQTEFEGLNEKNVDLDEIRKMIQKDKRLRQLIRES